MQATSIEDYPYKYESWLKLSNGTDVFLRPVISTDSHLLINLFNKISSRSLWFRFLRRIDSLSENMVYRLTHVNYNSEFALVAIIKEDEKDTIIAVGRYGYEPDEDITELAVAVRDDVMTGSD